MLNEKNLGTTFYIQYDPSLLKKKEKDICLYVIKRPEVTRHIVVSGGILGDLCFLFKTCLCFSYFLQMSLCDCFFLLIINVVKMSLHTLHGTKKDPCFSEFVGKKMVYVRVQFANYHNVQMDFKSSSFPIAR